MDIVAAPLTPSVPPHCIGQADVLARLAMLEGRADAGGGYCAKKDTEVQLEATVSEGMRMSRGG